ncbi:hypothetical protein PN823_004565 [Enterobacter hormaechei]|nr:hypothetical protein [Enterobacter hormaechei]
MALVHDNHTKNLNLPLPDKDNFLQDDVERLIETINTLDEKVALRATDGKLDPAMLPDNAATLTGGTLTPAQVPQLVVQVDPKTGKIPQSKLPPEGLTNILEASSQAAMLRLNATIGDVARRIDTNSYFMLIGSPSTERASWRELPQTAVYSVNGKVGAVTGIAASGVNHDITDLTGLTGQLHLPVDGSDDMAAVTKRQLDKAGGGYVTQVIWHHNRHAIPDGYIIGDGQEVSQTTFASLYAEVVAGRVPVCTEAEWWANPGKRGCYTQGATAGMFRLPDYNGVQNGSYAAPFLRGSYPTDQQYAGWMQQNAAPNITGSFDLRFAGTVASPWTIQTGVSGAFTYGAATNISAVGLAAGPSINKTQGTTFNANRSNAAYGRADSITNVVSGEVRPNAVVGVYIIRFAGRALNAGAIDALSLSTEVGKLSTFRDQITKLGNTIGYELVDFGAIAVGSRTVKPNPFGNNTPVICVAEIKIGNKWANTGWAYQTATTTPINLPAGGFGVRGHYSEGEGIVVQVGNQDFVANTTSGGASTNATPLKGTTSTVSCRVHVWNIGTDTTALTLQRAEVAKLSDLWLPGNDPRVLEYIEWPNDMVFGEGNSQVSPGELLVNIKPNAIQVKGIVRRPFKAALSYNTPGLTAAQVSANYITNSTTRRVLRVKKMLPGFTTIPRCYGTGVVDQQVISVKSWNPGATASALPALSTIATGRSMVYCGMNDGAHITYPANYLNVLYVSEVLADHGWYIFDIVIPFA